MALYRHGCEVIDMRHHREEIDPPEFRIPFMCDFCGREVCDGENYPECGGPFEDDESEASIEHGLVWVDDISDFGQAQYDAIVDMIKTRENMERGK